MKNMIGTMMILLAMSACTPTSHSTNDDVKQTVPAEKNQQTIEKEKVYG